MFENSYSLVLSDEAREDISKALAVWQDRYGKNVAMRFDEAIQTVEDFIQELPFAGRELDFLPGVYEKTVSKKYQYSFYYRVDEDVLEVVAFSFQSKKQSPEKIKDIIISRLKGYATRRNCAIIRV